MRVYQIESGEGIDSLKAAGRPAPAPARGHILIRMRAASLNFRDLLIVRGMYRAVQPALLIPLSDGCGDVVEIGDGVTRFAVGDRVCPTFFAGWIGGDQALQDESTAIGGFLNGVLTELMVCDEQFAVKAPFHLSYEQAACLACAGVTAWAALYGPQPLKVGETVLTLGTGGVSTLAIQFAKAAGARVIATSSSDEKLKLARELGADAAINYTQTPDWDRQVLCLTDGLGVDHVIEVGGGDTLPRSIASTKLGGHIHMIGVLTDGEINPRNLMRRKTLRGISVGSRAHFEAMNRMLELHQIKPLIDRVFQFDDAAEAFRHLESQKHTGKVVIRFPY